MPKVTLDFIFSAIDKGVKATAQGLGGAIGEVGAQAGVSREALAGLKLAADDAGTSFDVVSAALAHMQQSAAEGGKGWNSLRISVRDANGELKDGDTLLNEVADGFAGIEDPALEAALATQLFGESGRQMVPMLKEGSAGLAEFRAEAERLDLEAARAQMTALGAVAVAAGTAINTALSGAIHAARTYGNAIYEAGEKTGMTSEALSGLKFAAEQSGVTWDALSAGISRMQKNAYDASTTSAKLALAFQSVGVNVRGANGQLKDGETLLNELANAFARVENPTLKAALAQAIFGETGVRMLPLLDQGAAGLAAFRAEAERLGLVLSQEDVEAANEFDDMLEKLKASGMALGVEIGQTLLPMLTALGEVLTDGLAALTRFADAHPTLTTAAVLAAGGLGIFLAQAGALLLLLVQLAPILTLIGGGGGLAGVAAGATGVGQALAALAPLLLAGGLWVLAAIAVAGLAYELWKLKGAYDAAAEAGRQANADFKAQQEMEDRAVAEGRMDPKLRARQAAEVQAARPTLGERLEGVLQWGPGGRTGWDIARERVVAGQEIDLYQQRQGGGGPPRRIEMPQASGAPAARPIAAPSPTTEMGARLLARSRGNWGQQAAAAGGITINVQGDIYDGQRFEERVGRVVGRVVGR